MLLLQLLLQRLDVAAPKQSRTCSYFSARLLLLSGCYNRRHNKPRCLFMSEAKPDSGALNTHTGVHDLLKARHPMPT
jgi:hypothetical protein